MPQGLNPVFYWKYNSFVPFSLLRTSLENLEFLHQFLYHFNILFVYFSITFADRFFDAFLDNIFQMFVEKGTPKSPKKRFRDAGPQKAGHIPEPNFGPRLLLAPFGFCFASFFASICRCGKAWGSLLAPVSRLCFLSCGSFQEGLRLPVGSSFSFMFFRVVVVFPVIFPFSFPHYREHESGNESGQKE